ncbi:hypothetical protein FA15DRAFT_669504 [Coprinopsis marcescibilis]|uniref:G domain-containing protein n=1 Tax=Coprinopsis marcescibilis TaxID=230819 RepID=A0A5C3KWA9_COPMA|nr:hypothetical protein FA15DRAFT_669504 [Coprinopsis marcescibilis]
MPLVRGIQPDQMRSGGGKGNEDGTNGLFTLRSNADEAILKSEEYRKLNGGMIAFDGIEVSGDDKQQGGIRKFFKRIKGTKRPVIPLESIEHGSEEYPIIIVVMGLTGAGKSKLVNDYAEETLAVVGDKQASQTKETKGYGFSIGGKHLILVDTPGSNDTVGSDKDCLEGVAGWMAERYKKGTPIAGVIYLYDASSNRVKGSMRNDFTIFQKLCGPDYFRRVFIGLSHCDAVSAKTLEDRTQELKSLLWKDVLGGGGSVWALTADHESEARKVDVRELVHFVAASHLLGLDSSRVTGPLAIQRELVDFHMTLAKTEAGKELRRTLAEYLKHLEERKTGTYDTRELELQMNQIRRDLEKMTSLSHQLLKALALI